MLLDLIWWERETGLDKRMIKRGVVLAASHEGEADQIGEHGPGAILSVKPKQGALRRKLVRCAVARDGREGLAQFHSVAPIASVAKRAEPLETVGLTDDRAGPDHLSALASPVARGTDVIQPAMSRGQWGKARWRAASRVPSISKTTQVFLARSTMPPVCVSLESLALCESGRLSRSSRQSVRRASTGASVSAAKKRERVERAGSWSRSNRAMKGTAKGWSLS